MRDLQEMILMYERSIEKSEKSIASDKAILSKLKESVEVSIEDVFKDFAKYFEVACYDGEYENILGGDDRSAPWSVKEKGKIAEVKVKDGWFVSLREYYGPDSKSNVDRIKSYIKALYQPDHIYIHYY